MRVRLPLSLSTSLSHTEALPADRCAAHRRLVAEVQRFKDGAAEAKTQQPKEVRTCSDGTKPTAARSMLLFAPFCQHSAVCLC